MSQQITITLPAIDETIINQIETETTSTHETETAAIAALRERYAPLARHNGFIKIASRSNQWRDDVIHLRDAKGVRIKGLLVVDDFSSANFDQNTGSYGGSQLWLAADGRWIEITRDGTWSQWQGSTDMWTCGDVFDSEYDEPFGDGDIKALTDSGVAAQYKLADICDGLGKSLATLAEKLPQRLTKIRERATLASDLLAKLGVGVMTNEKKFDEIAIPATHAEAIEAIAALDAAKWGESEREPSRRMNAKRSYGLLLNSLAHRPEYDFGDAVPHLVKAAKKAMTPDDIDELSLR